MRQPILDANRGDILTALKLSENEPNEFFRDNVRRDMRILIEDIQRGESEEADPDVGR